jgi:hypothetical protein
MSSGARPSRAPLLIIIWLLFAVLPTRMLTPMLSNLAADP